MALILDPAKDGITHVNMYSKSATGFGQMLSNFYHSPVTMPEGRFQSVEAYWYYLSIPAGYTTHASCPMGVITREDLKPLYGLRAKQTGRAIRADMKKHNVALVNDPHFQSRIEAAIRAKLFDPKNTPMFRPEYRGLPITHYYAYGDTVRDMTPRFPWLTECLNRLVTERYEALFGPAKAPRIGITERGDAAVDLSWETKLPRCDMAVIITKNPARPEFQEALLRHKDKCLLHATITGWGASVLEPNVPDYLTALNGVLKLVSDGFPADHVVIRIDPIMPWNTEPSRLVFQAAYRRGFRRFRISMLDEYAHTAKRFHEARLLTASDMGMSKLVCIDAVNRLLDTVRQDCPGIAIEACAEPELKAEQKGYINPDDMRLFGLTPPASDPTRFQRPTCLCCVGKTELLTTRHRCPHQCLYCYWKD